MAEKFLLEQLIELEEAKLIAECEWLLRKIKRDCNPEFAERVETCLRECDLLLPNSKMVN